MVVWAVVVLAEGVGAAKDGMVEIFEAWDLENALKDAEVAAECEFDGLTNNCLLEELLKVDLREKSRLAVLAEFFCAVFLLLHALVAKINKFDNII